MFLHSVQRRYSQVLHRLTAQRIVNTPPITYRHTDDVIIVSQVCHRDIYSYLVAIKSFLYYLGYGAVHVINDGSLTSSDIDLIRQHIPHVVLFDIAEIDTGPCPRGKCWERLIHIIQLIENRYVIQLDADTISVGLLPEIWQAIQEQTSFCIGDPVWNLPTDATHLATLTNRWKWSDHPQVCTEQHMHKLISVKGIQYCRGCAGFSGFPVQQHALEKLKEFSLEIESMIGKQKWEKWGSEQVASNVMVSLSHGAHVLPWPKYRNYGFPCAYEIKTAPTSLYHFIGTYRHHAGLYRRLTRDFICQLLQ